MKVHENLLINRDKQIKTCIKSNAKTNLEKILSNERL
jgi:hypothetical protein